MAKRTIVYVDGFNLYYRALAHKPHKCSACTLSRPECSPTMTSLKSSITRPEYRETETPTNLTAKPRTCGH